MKTYKITTLPVGTITRKKSNMIAGASAEPVDFPLLCFLLENEERKILIDTGGSTPNGVNWMPYRRDASESLESRLAEYGVSPEEINAVFFTHLHWDHCGNNALFTNATFYVQKLEYDYIAVEERGGYERSLVTLSDYTLLDGNTEEVLPGISVILTPGHSVGSQSILVNTERGKVIFSGDTIPTFENIRLHVPNSANYDNDVIMNSMERILAYGYEIIPGHAIIL